MKKLVYLSFVFLAVSCGNLDSFLGGNAASSSALNSGSETGDAGKPKPPGAKPPGYNAEWKGKVCHIPPGNPSAQQTLEVGASAVAAHIAHGDKLGECKKPEGEYKSSDGKDDGKDDEDKSGDDDKSEEGKS